MQVLIHPSTVLTQSTLMDVLSGRKTRGVITGDIFISGFPKKQDTFARVSGYCEQNDIHSPQITVRESLIFSAFLRLDPDVDNETKEVSLAIRGFYTSFLLLSYALSSRMTLDTFSSTSLYFTIYSQRRSPFTKGKRALRKKMVLMGGNPICSNLSTR
jgi:hypothetical protein